jgi:hypothetical protein
VREHLEKYKASRRLRQPLTVESLSQRYFDAEVTAEMLWLEAAARAEEGELAVAADLYPIALLAWWDLRQLVGFSDLYDAEKMARLIEAETATPQLQAVHAIMCGEPDARGTWQFVADICEANPGNGIATILCARRRRGELSRIRHGTAADWIAENGRVLCRHVSKRIRPARAEVSKVHVHHLGERVRPIVVEQKRQAEREGGQGFFGRVLELRAQVAPAAVRRQEHRGDAGAIGPARPRFSAGPQGPVPVARRRKLLLQMRRGQGETVQVLLVQGCALLVRLIVAFCFVVSVLTAISSTDCQNKDWSEHKVDCKRWTASASRTGPAPGQALYKVQVPMEFGFAGNKELLAYKKDKVRPWCRRLFFKCSIRRCTFSSRQSTRSITNSFARFENEEAWAAEATFTVPSRTST